MAPGSRTLTYTPARLAWSNISTRSRNAAVSQHGDVFLSSRSPKFLAVACLQSLERLLICVPIDVIADPPPPEGALADRVLHAFA